ncbi:MAG: phosphoglucomutase [Bacteroidetes bacterium GWC2_33_15]|nr:MAG: phosphoglucomutase [Bacteroidetes bacterium GWA2_33_15]OFX48788.1 MAG: phosphoglucomutase [Bacteroidetes bacterium GWC2_33_15]OFX66030.1 MAG: phosphoglucomutase [Bacteroidetes bacterium GWB2_32_14]OFX68208.1 MAG: phosphoglucomutase [Bacteroidetes bacterium GWD2_33_33]HAN17984.1 phosphoglucomutase [Bacteroidales bacterium]
MADRELVQQVREKANKWLKSGIDQESKRQIENLLNNDQDELIESFYKDLEFGTGGLRGIMGIGTNRVNIYTVGMATQGLSNYLKQQFSEMKQIKVAIAYDSRNNSRLFAEKTASVFSANGIKAYLFESLRPTPELSFAIRHLKCQSGVVITASHNPKEYNGYKAYWDDGGQIISPHDKNIIAEVQKINKISDVLFDTSMKNVEIIGEKTDFEYVKELVKLSLNPEIIKKHKDLKIVYTPIHGSGVNLVPRVLKEYGFENIISVQEQNIPDGNFPTVKSPNPEEPAALQMAIEKAKKVNADIVMATDPDGDRVGIAVKDLKGDFVLLNGNQTAALLLNYLISQWKEKGKLKGKEYIVKTIVTSEILTEIAQKYKVEYFDVLTGFKYIADIIKQNEGKKKFIGGGEESYGYLAGEFVRDKDAVMSCALIAETAAFIKNQNKTLYEALIDIYIEFGFYKETLISLVRKGKSGDEEIKKMMEDYRNSPPQTINNSNVMLIHDFLKQKTFDQISHLRYDINLPKSDVLQFILHDGTKISIRPSGTEPKIKFYFGVKEKLDKREDFEKVNTLLDEKIKNIIKSLNIK